MRIQDRLYINGEWVSSRASGVLEVINASTEEVMARVPAGSSEDVERAAGAARRAFEGWASTPVAERARYLRGLSEGLAARADEIAGTIAGEVGMPLRLSRAIQAGLPITVMASYSEMLTSFCFEERIGNSLVVREPVGVVGAIADGMVLVAVQSLHLFYTKERDVVGSWMTTLGREHAIADNILYVTEVVARVRSEFPGDGPLVYVGFSQGVAMAYRAAARVPHPARGLIVLGGDVPPDVADDDSVRLPPVLIGRGDRDGWFTAARLENDLARLARLGASARSLVFEGGHEWTPAFLAAAGDFLRAAAEAPA